MDQLKRGISVTVYLIRTNFGAEKIWRNWRNLPEIAKLNPLQIFFFSGCAKLNPRQIKKFSGCANFFFKYMLNTC